MNISIKKRIEQIIGDLDQLPSIPDIALSIITMIIDPEVEFRAIAAEISKNQSLTTNILKICNSAYFSKGNEISSIERAVVTLGLKEVKDIVILASTKAVLNKTIIGYDLTQGELWRHALAVAMVSKKIAEMKGHRDIADIAFTGGIIHDVGKTVLALFVQSTFQDILNMVEHDHLEFHAAEKIIMGFDHQDIGERIIAKWNFPESLRAIAHFHHRPEDAPEKFRVLVSIVHIANVICLMAGVGIGNDGLYQKVSDAAISLIDLTDHEFSAIYADIPDIVRHAMDMG